MKMLDRKRPYGEVFGEHPYRFTQDGAHFDSKGRLIGGRKEPEKTKPEQKEPEEVPLDKLPIQELKDRVAAAGGTYTNRLDAEAFLRDLP